MTETIAASSAATEPQTPAQEPAVISIPRDAEGYGEWRQTGKLPEKPATPPKKTSKTADSATATSSEAGNGDESGAGSEPAEGKQGAPPKKSKADLRLQEILADIKRAGLTPEELKTFKRAEAAAAAATPTATAADKAPDAAKGPVKPKIDDFTSMADYDVAIDKWHEDVADFRAKIIVAQDKAKEAAAKSTAETNAKLAEAVKRYGGDSKETIEGTAKTIYTDKAIQPLVKALLSESPILADLMYVLGSKPEQLDEFVDMARSRPGEAVRRLVLLEKLTKEELAKAAKPAAETTSDNGDESEDKGSPNGTAAGRDANGKFVSGTPPPAKKLSQAPPPATELSGTRGAPEDPVDKAGKTQDFRAYQAAANARDLARKQGR